MNHESQFISLPAIVRTVWKAGLSSARTNTSSPRRDAFRTIRSSGTRARTSSPSKGGQSPSALFHKRPISLTTIGSFRANSSAIVGPERTARRIDPGPPVSFFSDISTVHSNDTILNPVTVSGYPASLNVQDGRSYSYTDGTGLDDGLTVDSLAYGNVTMKVGDVMLSFGTFFTVPQQTLTAVPTGTYASSSYAKWNQYVDPTSLVTQFDNWIDYIRVLKIN